MKNPIVPVLLVLAFNLCCFRVQAECGNDMECKGERICVEGNCVFPPQPPKATETATPPPPSTSDVTTPPGAPSTGEPAPQPHIPPASNSTAPPMETPTASPMAPVEQPVTPAPALVPVAEEPVPSSPPPPPTTAPQSAAAAPAPSSAVAPQPTPTTISAPPEPALVEPEPQLDAAAPSASSKKNGVPHFHHGYGDVGMVLGFGTAGRMFMFAEGESDSDSLRGGPMPGIRIAGYGVSRNAHLGAYFTARFGELEFQDEKDDVRMLSFGYSHKYMRTAQVRRVKAGFVFDIGLVFTQNEDMAHSSIEYKNDTFIGMEFFPRFELDIVAVNTGGFKLVVPISIGMYLLPVNAMRLLEDPVTVTAVFAAFQPAMIIGVEFGG